MLYGVVYALIAILGIRSGLVLNFINNIDSSSILAFIGIVADASDTFIAALLKAIETKNLIPYTSFKIKASCGLEELTKIVKILCYVQYLKTIPNFLKGQYFQVMSYSEIMHNANLLYGDKILIQPFLEGVALGDIRINLAKNNAGNFEIVGSVFRKNINNDDNFTTGITAGHARAVRVEEVVTQEEAKNLKSKINFILEKLNNELKDKYKNSLELGCDFLLKGDKKTVYLGEVNHYCPALAPLSEALQNKALKHSFYDEIGGVKINYDGGLAVAKYVLKWQIQGF